MVGDQGGEGTPGLFPNPEVKLSSDMASSGESYERQDVADLTNFLEEQSSSGSQRTSFSADFKKVRSKR